MDGQGSRGTAKDISALARGLLFMLKGVLGLEGPDFPCCPGFGGRSKVVPVEAPAVSRDSVAMATSHALVMGR